MLLFNEVAKLEKRKREQEEAASKIAAIQRGRKARKEKKKQVEAVNKIAAIQRGRNARKKMSTENKQKSAAQSFKVGQRVRARFAGKGHFYNGKITADNRDGTFGIEYDDGDWEDELDGKFIQVIEKKPVTSAVQVEEQQQQFVVNTVDPKDIASENNANLVNTSSNDKQRLVEEYQKLGYGLNSTNDKQRLVEEYQKLGYGLNSHPNTVDDPVESSCEKSDRTFFVGQRVRARFAGKAHFYNGKITADNGDGTFGIEYDDGDWEDELKAEYIQVISKKKKLH